MTDVDISSWTLAKLAHKQHIRTVHWLATGTFDNSGRYVGYSTCLLMPLSRQLLDLHRGNIGHRS